MSGRGDPWAQTRRWSRWQSKTPGPIGARRGYRRSGPPLGASLRDDSGVTQPGHHHTTNPLESVTLERYSHLNGHCCEDRLSLGWPPWSEWWISPGSGRRRASAIFSASTTRLERMWGAIDQPTISRE